MFNVKYPEKFNTLILTLLICQAVNQWCLFLSTDYTHTAAPNSSIIFESIHSELITIHNYQDSMLVLEFSKLT